MDDRLVAPQGEFVLHRLHHDPRAPLRAWDAADEYVLDHLEATGATPTSTLVVNDAFGALAVATAAMAAGGRVVSWSDSHVAMSAAAANLARNDVDPTRVTFVPSTEDPAGPFDLLIVKIPRALAFLEDQLRRLRPLLHEDSLVIGAGMTRTIHRSTIEAFEHTVGPSPTTHARKKARLLLPTFDPTLDVPAPRPPVSWKTPGGLAITSAPNVHSATALDRGTRLLLANLPTMPAGTTVIDLGCGNGVVGATLASRNPGLHIVACDESHQAVESARRTIGAIAPDSTFHVTDALDGIADGSADEVVVNPPFHTGGVRTTEVADRMFAGARRVLRDGGRLWAVGNRHLGHHIRVGGVFGSVEVVASDPRFVVLRASR